LISINASRATLRSHSGGMVNIAKLPELVRR
jgi:hypothetical protein